MLIMIINKNFREKSGLRRGIRRGGRRRRDKGQQRHSGVPVQEQNGRSSHRGKIDAPLPGQQARRNSGLQTNTN